LESIARHRPSILMAVPMMYAMLVEHAASSRPPDNLSSLRLALAGGSKLQRSTAQRFHELFGLPITEFYAMTEIRPIAANNVPGLDKPGSVGRLAPGVKARILDDSGRAVAPGVEGTLVVRSPTLMLGYYRRPDMTAAVMRDGWFDTGDRAMVDADGFYWLVGRDSEVINRGGAKISPAEVEAVLLQHEAVRDAAVVGI